ncbi:MAG: response regulator [Eubacterium sp.]|nr:response regulator [Eubacterium sp.]
MEEKQKVVIEQTGDLSDRKHILVVDDDLNMLKTLRYYLQDQYKVTVVNSGKVAVDFLLKYTPDLILLDYMMPVCNGAEVLKIIKSREETKDIPVYFLSGLTDQNTVKECLSLEPAGYIIKPVAKEALLAKMKEAFAQSY